MKKTAVLLAFIFSSFLAQANSIDPYYQISDVTVEVLDSNARIKNYVQPDPGTGTQVREVISILRDIIAFGREVYKIVEKGRPVINTNYAPISVLPLDTEFGKDITPMKLSHWKIPKFTKFKVTYKDGYGSEVVSFTYNVNLSYGGQYQGKGAFISNVQIVPENISVLWGYTFNAKMSLVGLTNLGSEAEPVAGATLQLSYSVSTVVKEDRNNVTIFVAGDGTIQQM